MKRILVVENDVMLNSALCYNLELDVYRAVPAHDVETNLIKTCDLTNIEQRPLKLLITKSGGGNSAAFCYERKFL